MISEGTVVYTAPRPRYVVQTAPVTTQWWRDKTGYTSLGEAIQAADIEQSLHPDMWVQVIKLEEAG